MSSNEDILKREKVDLDQIPSDAIAYYTPHSQSRKRIYFSKDTLLLMYHLVRLKYFSRDMIFDQYYILTKKKLSKRVLYSLIGNKTMPITSFSDDYRIMNVKFFYVSKSFTTWLLNIVHEIPEFIELMDVTEYEGSHYSLVTNRISGGKNGIKKINPHDYNARKLCLKIGRELIDRLPDISPRELNITYFFPTNRELISVVPDAVIFVQGERYYLEYDRNTEQHYKLLAKIIGYFEETYYAGDSIFFVFDNIAKPRNNLLHKRVENFISNVNQIKYNDTGLTYFEQAQRNQVSLYALPSVNSISQITEKIIDDIMQDQEQNEEELIQQFKKAKVVPYEIVSVEFAENIDGPFDYLLTYIDDYFEKQKMPLVKMYYGDVSMPSFLETLYQNFKNDYQKCGVIFSKEITQQYYPLPHDDFFTSLYM